MLRARRGTSQNTFSASHHFYVPGRLQIRSTSVFLCLSVILECLWLTYLSQPTNHDTICKPKHFHLAAKLQPSQSHIYRIMCKQVNNLLTFYYKVYIYRIMCKSVNNFNLQNNEWILVKFLTVQRWENVDARKFWSELNFGSHRYIYYHILSYSLGSIFYQYTVVFLFNLQAPKFSFKFQHI